MNIVENVGQTVALEHIKQTSKELYSSCLSLENHETCRNTNTFECLEFYKGACPSMVQRCFNYSYLEFPNHDTGVIVYYIALLVKVPYCKEDGKDNVTWQQALQMCQHSGGYLPILRDAREMWQFVAC